METSTNIQEVTITPDNLGTKHYIVKLMVLAGLVGNMVDASILISQERVSIGEPFRTIVDRKERIEIKDGLIIKVENGRTIRFIEDKDMESGRAKVANHL